MVFINNGKNKKYSLILLVLISVPTIAQSYPLLDLAIRTTGYYFIQKVQITPRITQQLPPEARRITNNAINSFIRGALFGTTDTVYTGTKNLLLPPNEEQIARNNRYCNAISNHNVGNLDQIEKLINNCKTSSES